MPEGPEIAREADRIRDAIEREPIDRIHFSFPQLQRRASLFRGTHVSSVRARGKALLIGFSNGLTLYSHNQLYGRWVVCKAGSLPRTKRQLRVAIETPSRWALLYSASEIEILEAPEIEVHPYLAKLGPDPLDPDLTRDALVERSMEPRFVRRGLGSLLLDQAFVAGIGNYLRSEICFETRVHPARRPIELSQSGCRRLAGAILTLTRRAYRTGGVTLPTRRARALRRAGTSWSHARHWVFAREGQPCRLCTSTIDRFDLGSRRVYVCPSCQSPCD